MPKKSDVIIKSEANPLLLFKNGEKMKTDIKFTMGPDIQRIISFLKEQSIGLEVSDAPKIESFNSFNGILHIRAAVICPNSCNAAASNAAIEIYECVQKRVITIKILKKLIFILIGCFFIKKSPCKDIKSYVARRDDIKIFLQRQMVRCFLK